MKSPYDKFAVFILTHGRPDNVRTVKALKDCGYTGEIWLIVDNEDSTASKYKENFHNVYIFDKEEAKNLTDTQDNGNSKAAVVFARNMVHSIALELGYEYFLELDDDYTSFRHTFYDNKYLSKRPIVCSMDNIIFAYLEFLDKSGALTVCFSQGGDFIGGEGSGLSKQIINGSLSRKAMNAFFMKTDRPFKFTGRINEDVNAYVSLAMKGEKLFTVGQIRLEQIQTQSNKGGLTDIYLEKGTYVKSFYSIMAAPSCVSLMEMGVENMRIHHKVSWNKCAPKIINDKHKKGH
ncbi:MAG TPA: hypothetical protein VMV86_03345 [Methanosarcinales archaeon]|nr:hypothetical protein [Methanosarcinales archaeon]